MDKLESGYKLYLYVDRRALDVVIGYFELILNVFIFTKVIRFFKFYEMFFVPGGGGYIVFGRVRPVFGTL